MSQDSKKKGKAQRLEVPRPNAETGKATGASPSADSKTVTVCIVLAVITLALFGPTKRFEFISYDDPEYVTENAVVRQGLTGQGIKYAFTQVHSANWHPLTTLSHMLDCQLVGLNA